MKKREGNEESDLNGHKEAFRALAESGIYRNRSNTALLEFVARRLSVLSNQMLLHRAPRDLPMITSAKAFIAAHYDEKLSLRQVAKAVHTNYLHFRKKFKETTGMNFASYLTRVRVEKAKNLLLNPHYEIDEIAYDVGFGSVTHFNRMFKRFAGLSPTAHRAQLGTGRTGRERYGNIRRHNVQTQAGLRERFDRNGRIRGFQESTVPQAKDRIEGTTPSDPRCARSELSCPPCGDWIGRLS
jgi:AraC-like DNA-binding protein